MFTIWDQAVENVREGFLEVVKDLNLDCHEAETLFLSAKEKYAESIFKRNKIRFELAEREGALSTDEENEDRRDDHAAVTRYRLNGIGLVDALVPDLIAMLKRELEHQAGVYHLRHLASARP